MIRRANNQKRVTYDHVVEEAGLEGHTCDRVFQDTLRAEGVSYKPPRRKVYVSEEDAEVREEVAKVWVRRPATFWSKKVKS